MEPWTRLETRCSTTATGRSNLSRGSPVVGVAYGFGEGGADSSESFFFGGKPMTTRLSVCIGATLQVVSERRKSRQANDRSFSYPEE